MSPFGCCVLVFLFSMTKKKKKKISVVTPAVTFFQNAVTDQVKKNVFSLNFSSPTAQRQVMFLCGGNVF